jgi:putative membrane protein
MQSFPTGLLAAIATVTVSIAAAQTPPSSSDPSAASSPHQRQATDSGTPEAPASTNGANPSDASTPHQRSAMQGAAPHGTAGASQSSPATFVTMAAQDGMTEVALGKLAQSKSNNPQVRQFAQKMVQDHGKADAELAHIAKAENLEVPTQLDAAHQKMVASLNAQSGAAFDGAYASHMAQDHTKAIDLFQSASNSGDPALAGFAKKTLPTLQEHKRLADHLSSITKEGNAAAEQQ